MSNLDDLLLQATSASEPTLIERRSSPVGGVDPLGLRQINFDLMDEVLPGLNNVAEKIRPFVLMTWAWRRVRYIVEQDKKGGATDDEMRDFVDRIEAIYAWSQFLIDPKAGIPGGQALDQLIHGKSKKYSFGGPEWEKRRDLRRTSTGLISPLNYGPGLRSMGWLIPVGPAGVFRPNPELDPMLDAFEARFDELLEHKAFNELGAITVKRKDVRKWGGMWALDDPTEKEQEAAFSRLAGPSSNPKRRDGMALIEATIEKQSDDEFDVHDIRAKMAETEKGNYDNQAIISKANAWRKVQTRQLFRLSLEGMFYWLVGELIDGPLSSESISERFVQNTIDSDAITAEQWFLTKTDNPVGLLEELNDALRGSGDFGIPELIRQGIAFCLTEIEEERENVAQANDRLPISRAKSEFKNWRNLSPQKCVIKIVEGWVLAQHAYWCVGRGLADARGRGKTLLRLRVVIEEGGWSLTPGANQGNPPVATPDRLQTALGLLNDCGRIPIQ